MTLIARMKILIQSQNIKILEVPIASEQIVLDITSVEILENLCIT